MEKDEIIDFIAALRKGATPSWDAFFAHFDQLIRSVVAWEKWRLDAHTREDVAQCIRQEIVKSITQIKEDANVEFFIKKICIHRIVDEIRRQVRTGRLTVPMTSVNANGETVEITLPASPADDPMRQIVLFERASAVRELIEQLGDPCRMAIRAFYFDGRRYKEIAESEGISINTVGTRLNKCLERLRGLMKRHTVFREERDSGFDSDR